MYKFTEDEQIILNDIKIKPYMKKSLILIEEYVNNSGVSEKTAYKNVFNEIWCIMNESKSFVDTYLSDRKKNSEIKDEKQAIKSIAGNSFSFMILYIFLKNKEYGNIREDIYITSKKSKVPSFNEISVINVDGKTKKPDCDIIIYSLNNDKSLKKCMIVSLKTSLRERAGQTYKWKLLMEIASSSNTIKEKYNISYNPKEIPLVCFATVNFYDEINNPQSKGMFKFFDKAFIAKNIDVDFITKMSNLIDYVNSVL